MTGNGVVVLGLADDVAAHLVRAIAQHGRWCRDNGVRVPAQLSQLLSELASTGQARPTVATFTPEAHDASVLLLDYDAAAGRLGVSARTVRRLTAAGALPVVEVGGCRRIRASDLADYVMEL